MARVHSVTNAATGETTEVPFTQEEEDAADAAEAAIDPRASFPKLWPWQFEAIIELSGITMANLTAIIGTIPDTEFKVKALAKLKNPPGGVYSRTDPLFSNAYLMMQLQKTAEEIDALWMQAAALT